MDAVALLRNLIPIAVLFIVCDIPWLYISSTYAQSMLKRIQGGTPFQVRWAGAIPVYLALAYLVQQATSTWHAFLTGLCVYAVYDFTNYATLVNYTLEFAIADSLWGGILFTIVRQAALWLHLI